MTEEITPSFQSGRQSFNHSSQQPGYRLTTADWSVFAFSVLYLMTALVAAITLQNREFLIYIGVTVVLMSITLWTHLQVRFHPVSLWGLSVWGLVHMAGGLLRVPDSWPIGGETPVLYNLWLIPGLLKFDQVVHAYGFGLMTWISWQGLQKAFANRGVALTPTLGTLTLCVMSATGFGALNEVIEFIATRILPKTNVGGYENTGWDLVSNLAGSLIASLLIHATHRHIAPGASISKSSSN